MEMLGICKIHKKKKILSAKSEAYNNSYCMNAYNTSSMKIIHIQT